MGGGLVSKSDAVTIVGMEDRISVLSSLQKPKKIVLMGRGRAGGAGLLDRLVLLLPRPLWSLLQVNLLYFLSLHLYALCCK